jgi:hypothetical protein
VEKVLSPPQKPLSSRSVKPGERGFFIDIKSTRAKIKQALMFEIKVAQGSDNADLRKIRPMPYLHADPVPPPRNTIRAFIIGIFFLEER